MGERSEGPGIWLSQANGCPWFPPSSQLETASFEAWRLGSRNLICRALIWARGWGELKHHIYLCLRPKATWSLVLTRIKNSSMTDFGSRPTIFKGSQKRLQVDIGALITRHGILYMSVCVCVCLLSPAFLVFGGTLLIGCFAAKGTLNMLSSGALIAKIEFTHTVDGCEIYFAPPKKSWKDDSSVNANKQWFPMVSKWCRNSSINSRNANSCGKSQPS